MSKHLEPIDDALFDPLTGDEGAALSGGEVGAAFPPRCVRLTWTVVYPIGDWTLDWPTLPT